jgi:hypothetical protein
VVDVCGRLAGGQPRPHHAEWEEATHDQMYRTSSGNVSKMSYARHASAATAKKRGSGTRASLHRHTHARELRLTRRAPRASSTAVIRTGRGQSVDGGCERRRPPAALTRARNVEQRQARKIVAVTAIVKCPTPGKCLCHNDRVPHHNDEANNGEWTCRRASAR